MSHLKMKYVLSASILLVVSAMFGGCNKKTEEVSSPAESSVIIDEPITEFQVKLLDAAFDIAAKIPVYPHIKDRSRAQEDVVETCLKLHQVKRALDDIPRIENWRNGSCYADIAMICAEKGNLKEMQRYVDMAGKVAETAEDWRKDHIRIKLAQVHTLLGKTEQSKIYQTGVTSDSEIGKVERIRARVTDEASFAEEKKALDALIKQGNFDIGKNALYAYAQLFDTFYDDPQRRTQIEETIKSSWIPMPIDIRVKLLEQLAQSALDHADKDKALRLINETNRLIENYQWPLRFYIPMKANIMKLCIRAGDAATARSEADAALAMYREKSDQEVNIYRAGTLRPLAEVYHQLGDTQTALSLYKQTVEEGMANPNSRPRAQDLSATCCSMALNAVEPDSELWTRIQQIREGLGQPW